MDVPITQFRRDLFKLADQALEGRAVWITHKGRRLKLAAEGNPADKLSRITPMDVLVDENFDPNDPAFRTEWMAAMEKEWEEDWSQIGPPASDDRLS
jgi:hypothetical protein